MNANPVPDAQQTLSQVVLDHPECVPVFHRHRIDFCCGGEATLAAASAQKKLPLDALLGELGAAIVEHQRRPDCDPRQMPTPRLLEHIIERHHAYLRKTMPYVVGLSRKVARVHGEHNPRLLALEAAVDELDEALMPHLDDEEAELFPALCRDAEPERERLREDLRAMREEHRAVGELIDDIHDSSEEFRVPEWACTSYRALFGELERLVEDVMLHVHLENNVVAPRFGA